MSSEQEAPKEVPETAPESAPKDEKVDDKESRPEAPEKVPEQESVVDVSDHSGEGSDREEDEYESAEEHDDQTDDKRRRRETREEEEEEEVGEAGEEEELFADEGEGDKPVMAVEKKAKEPREDGDGQEAEDADGKMDDDEDRRNPQYIPKRGMFYEHDDRIDSDDEEAKKKAAEEESKKKKRVWKSEATNKWGHDKFAELDQVPKSKEELVEAYGYDIRTEDNAPRARRRRRYGRGPNKYTRNWEDEEAYSGPPQKDSRGRGRGGRGGGTRQHRSEEDEEEFPALANKDAVLPREESNRGSFRGAANRGRGAFTRADDDVERHGDNEIGRRGGDADSGSRAEDAVVFRRNDEGPSRRGGDEGTGRRGDDPMVRRDDDATRRRNDDPTSRRRDDQYPRRGEEEARRGSDARGRGASRGGRGGFRDERREDRGSGNERLVKPGRPSVEHTRETLEHRMDGVEKDLARTSLEDRRSTKANEKPRNLNQQQVDDSSGKRYSSLRQPKHQQQQPPPQPQQRHQHHHQQQIVSSHVHADISTTSQNYYEQAPIVVTSSINGAHYATYPSEALAAAFPPGHYPNGPPAGAPFISSQPIRPGSVPHPSSYINPGMVNYGPPPVQYTPVTVPMPMPLVGLPAGPHDTFVPPALPGGTLLPPHLSVVTSPEQQVLMVASPPPGSQGYAVERGGVTYFNPTAQAPIVQRAVSRRPKAAIPIVDPSQLRGDQEEEMSQPNEGSYVELDGGSCELSKISSDQLAAET